MRILFVDDEPDICEVAVIALELEPEFEVRSCASGDEALAGLAAWRPDLILLDVMMPRMDGPAILKALRADPATRAIPVTLSRCAPRRTSSGRFAPAACWA